MRASATRSSSCMASRMTAKASAPVLPFGAIVIGLVQITLVDVGPRHEPVDIDSVSALDLDRLQLVFVDFDILPLGQFVTAPLVPGVNHAAGLLVDHLLAEPVSGLRVYLMKMGLLGL